MKVGHDLRGRKNNLTSGWKKTEKIQAWQGTKPCPLQRPDATLYPLSYI